MINYFVTKNHFYTILPFLKRWDNDADQFIRIVPYEKIDKINFVTNDIYLFSDLDRLDQATFNKAINLCDRISENVGEQFILNHPKRFLGRFALLKLLWKEGVNDYRVYPADALDPACRYPVFIRRANDHRGPLTPLIADENEYRHYLSRLTTMGVAMEELIAIEYCDTRHKDGTYRKYSAFRLGPVIIPGHVIFSDDWVAKDNKKGPPREEAISYLRTNPHEIQLREIFDLAKLDYGRIDYSLNQGRIQVWEINTNPMLVALPGKYAPAMQEQKRQLVQKLGQSFLSLDKTLCQGQQVIKDFDGGLLETHSRAFPGIDTTAWKTYYYECRFFVNKYFEALVKRGEKCRAPSC